MFHENHWKYFIKHLLLLPYTIGRSLEVVVPPGLHEGNLEGLRHGLDVVAGRKERGSCMLLLQHQYDNNSAFLCLALFLYLLLVIHLHLHVCIFLFPFLWPRSECRLLVESSAVSSPVRANIQWHWQGHVPLLPGFLNSNCIFRLIIFLASWDATEPGLVSEWVTE